MTGYQLVNNASLLAACSTGDVNTVRFILHKRGDVETNDSGVTCLNRTAYCENPDSTTVLELLLERKAKVNIVNAYGTTPLMDAVKRCGNYKNDDSLRELAEVKIRMLVEAAADVNVKTPSYYGAESGKSLSWLAENRGNPTVFEILQ